MWRLVNAVLLCAVELMAIAVWRNKRLPAVFLVVSRRILRIQYAKRHVSGVQKQ